MNMNLYTPDSEKNHKSSIKSKYNIKPAKEKDYSDGVTNEEEARIIIKALKNAEKIARGEIKTRPFNEDGWLDELIKWADNERKKENEQSN